STLRTRLWPTLFPYTTLFRSLHRLSNVAVGSCAIQPLRVLHDPPCCRVRLHGLSGIPTFIEGFQSRRRLVRCCIGGNLQPNIFRSEEHTSELQSRENLVCRLL